MHHLSHVAICNFRSCSDVTIALSPYTPIVGQNNCGKSNIIAAIAWLLRPYGLAASDFGDIDTQVVVSGRITGLTPEHLDHVAPEHRTRIAPYCATGELRIRRIQSSPGGSTRGIVLEIRDPTVESEDADGAWRRNPTGIDAAIQSLFPEPIHIKAMQDAVADVTSGKKESTIGRLVATLIGTLEASHGSHLTQALEGIRERLSISGTQRAPELVAFDEGANEYLSDLFPGVRVKLHFEPPKVTDLFKAGTIKAFEGKSDEERDVENLGHGAQRAIQMALVRYLASISRSRDEGSCTLLLIDEPELYLHPHAIEQVRLALISLAKHGYQVVFSTHSPLMIGLEDVAVTVMVHKPADAGTAVRKRILEAWEEAVSDAPSQSRTLFEFGNASRILFADGVVIAEGVTEQRLMPALYEAFRKRSLMSVGIALINTGGSGGIAKCLRLLSALDIPAVAVVDLDYAFRRAVMAGLVVADDPDIRAFRLLTDEMKDIRGIEVDTDGFPKKGRGYSAAEAFALLAKDDRAKPIIASLSVKLRAHRIWLWNRGSIEEHLGIDGKDEESWTNYCQRLRTQPLEDVVSDYAGVSDLIDWIETSPGMAQRTFA